jgi:hypothetical protein
MSPTPFPLLSCLLPAPAPASARSVFGLRPHELHDKDRRLSWGREEREKAAKSKSTPLTGPRGLDQHWAGKRQGYIGLRDSVALPQCGKALKGRAGRGEIQDGFSLRLDSAAPLTRSRSRSPRL